MPSRVSTIGNCGRSLSAMGKTFLHLNLLAVGVIAVGFIALALVLEPKPNILNIAPWVFAISGTMVALVIPAAGLAGGLITRIVEYWLKRVADTEEKNRPQKARLGLEFIKEAKKNAIPALRGSIYVLCAFFLSSIAIFAPRITLCSCTILVDFGLLGIALGFLLVGAFLFYPFALWAYRLVLLEEVEEAFRGTAAQDKQPETKNIEKPA